MRNRVRWNLVPVAGILIFVTSQAMAQTDFDTQWNVGEGLWSEDANWVFLDGSEAEAPSTNFDESAWIGNGGTAIVDSSVPDVVKLQVPNGTVLIQQGGSLKAVNSENLDAMGPSDIGRNGTLSLSGNGSLSTVDLKNNGRIELNSLGANFNVTGDLNHNGTLALNITSAGTSKVTVGGAATLAGTIAADFDNSVNLAFGDSFEFLSGASSVANNGARVVVPDSVVLDSGLAVQLINTNSSASLTVGNLPVLTVHRATGAAAISNIVGGPLTMTGYTIASERGLLNPAGLAGLAAQGAEGWVAPNPLANTMSEFNLTGEKTLLVDETLSLGNAYSGGPTVPSDEDVTFQFSTPDGRFLDGLVEYTGPANDLVLNANPETGEVTIQHLSALIDPVEVTGYHILSASGTLIGDNWTSFSDTGLAGTGWTETTPQATGIAELNLSESKVFTNGTVISLGNIFDVNGVRDLRLEYTTTEELFLGTVEYQLGGPISVPGDCNGDGVVNRGDLACVSTIEERDTVLAAIPTLAGDLDGNGDVAFADFLVLSANFGQDLPSYTDGNIDLQGGVAFPDFLVLSANFGQVPAGGATAAAVPEPSSLLLVSLGAVYLLGRRRNRIRKHWGSTVVLARG